MPLGHSKLQRLVVGMIYFNRIFTVLFDSTFLRESDERIFCRGEHCCRHLHSCEQELLSENYSETILVNTKQLFQQALTQISQKSKINDDSQ